MYSPIYCGYSHALADFMSGNAITRFPRKKPILDARESIARYGRSRWEYMEAEQND
jgi:hypothetical protein